MDVPQTVRAALGDRSIEGRRCLDAGAGAGNTTAGLLEAGASSVFAVTNEREHAETVSERLRDAEEVKVLESDLRAIALPDDSVDIVTAHALFNVVPPEALSTIVDELTRVVRPGGNLIVDDYAPLPETAEIRALFGIENAASELARNRPGLTFYPASVLQSVFEGKGWVFERQKTLLDPVPWTEGHVEAHADVACDVAAGIEAPLGGILSKEADRLASEIGSESAGEMYSLAFRMSESPG